MCVNELYMCKPACLKLPLEGTNKVFWIELKQYISKYNTFLMPDVNGVLEWKIIFSLLSVIVLCQTHAASRIMGIVRNSH